MNVAHYGGFRLLFFFFLRRNATQVQGLGPNRMKEIDHRSSQAAANSGHTAHQLTTG